VKRSDFSYHLPESSIAVRPCSPRDASRLLVVDRNTGARRHAHFRDFPDLLQPGDRLVTNDTRVMKARLSAHRGTGGRVEILLLEPIGEGFEANAYRAMLRPGRRLRVGEALHVNASHAVTVLRAEGDGTYQVALPMPGDALMEAFGKPPIPPYLRREADDQDDEDYQTVFAAEANARSVAAPTAGLHFTSAILDALKARGVEMTSVTLDVGPGTFQPMRVEDIETHSMHSERYALSESTADALEATRRRGGRIIAVGTTTTRVLESIGWPPRPGTGSTQLFIRPGHTFRVIDGLLTNFHLPESTLLMLVCAFAGREGVLDAYEEAVAMGYRFFSYGDAMFLKPSSTEKSA
jgi:S-adenosylmethionine:tRNA ribosyltransferase-isomerase